MILRNSSGTDVKVKNENHKKITETDVFEKADSGSSALHVENVQTVVHSII